MAQSWVQLSVHTHAESIDALSNFLMEQGAPGVVLKRSGIEAFFPTARAGAALRRDVRRYVESVARLSPRGPKPRLRWRVLKQNNWEHSWKRFIKARRVGKTFWVTPPWLDPPKFRRRRVITIEPGMAFGTGTHATTRGCMELLEQVGARFGHRGFKALDVGTGSGILAIALAHLGAREILAIDNDPVALEVAQGNLRVNGMETRVRLSGARLGSIRRHFDVVVANLTADTILELSNALDKKVAPHGFLILSGILHEQMSAVAGRFNRRLRLLKRTRSREWITLLLQRT